MVALSLTAGLLVARAELGDGLATHSSGFVALVLAFVILGRVLGKEQDTLWETARQDPLTAVGNRRSFEERVARELSRAVDSGMPLALLAIDLDRLKELNDRLGHQAGDRALRLLGQILKMTCRSRDLPARCGGDEFMVVMPRSTAEEAAVLGERIRALFGSEGSLAFPDVGASVSIGAADLTHVAVLDARTLCEAADRALYAAKRSGRNGVVLADDPRAAPASGSDRPATKWVRACTGPARCSVDPEKLARRCAQDTDRSPSCPGDVNAPSAASFDGAQPPENSLASSALVNERA